MLYCNKRCADAVYYYLEKEREREKEKTTIMAIKQINRKTIARIKRSIRSRDRLSIAQPCSQAQPVT
jgi:hypothetical protein